MKDILIADDFPLMRKKLSEILLDIYPEVNIIEVGNGNETLEQVTHFSFDLVLLDINMPGPNGLETMKSLQSLDFKTPVLMLSLNTEYPYAIKALEAGASGYLTKESSFEELIVAIEEIKSGRKYITKALCSDCCLEENVINPSLIEPYLVN
jgi:two-component system, NarL family, invasion response regulator UvrY